MSLDLQYEMESVARDVDQLRARLPMQTPKSFRRLCRIESPVDPTYNTYNVSFLDGTYTETAGVQSPTYVDRQILQTGVAHNLAGAGNVEFGDIVIVKRIGDRWWFRVGAGAVTPPTTKLIFHDWVDFNWDETNLQYVDPFTVGVGPQHRVNQVSLNRVLRRSAACQIELQNQIPQGSTIHEATLRATDFGAGLTFGLYPPYAATGVLEVLDDGNPPAPFTYTSQQIDNWTTVAGSTAYSISRFSGTYTDIDFTSMLQAVVNRGDFTGNRVNLKMTTDPTVGLGTEIDFNLTLKALQVTAQQFQTFVRIAWS